MEQSQHDKQTQECQTCLYGASSRGGPSMDQVLGVNRLLAPSTSCREVCRNVRHVESPTFVVGHDYCTFQTLHAGYLSV